MDYQVLKRTMKCPIHNRSVAVAYNHMKPSHRASASNVNRRSRLLSVNVLPNRDIYKIKSILNRAMVVMSGGLAEYDQEKT